MKNDWEKRFDEEFPQFGTPGGHLVREIISFEDVKSFIASELKKQKEEIVEIVKNELTPHEFESDNPLVEKAIQDSKLRHLDDIIKKLEGNE